jgi:citrate lyase beta subunit
VQRLPDRLPIHTVYGGAHLFRADSARKLGDLALRSLDAYAPDFVSFAKAVGLRRAGGLPDGREAVGRLDRAVADDVAAARVAHPDAWFAHAVYARVREKLGREAVEDFRLDFEDGYGHRPDDEEDATARGAAGEVALGLERGTLPPFLGIRIKPFDRALRVRGERTLDLFLTGLAERTRGEVPARFVVTLPKVVDAAQVAALADVLERHEARLGVSPGALRLEIMVETPQSIVAPDGRCPLAGFVEAGRGRCVGAHFGVYDYTAGLHITAEHQRMRHPACDHARQVMQVALAGAGVALSDGATNVLPVGPHRAAPGESLAPHQLDENRRVVHQAWRLHYGDVRHSLARAYYQGWDLHPAQFPTRYAAVYSFFLESLEAASRRLRAFVAQAGQATLVGDVFDDAATGQGLLNFFLLGMNCGAITEAEATATGLTVEELRSRSFVEIVAGRRRR